MKKFEEKFTAWVDGTLDPQEKKEFEAALAQDPSLANAAADKASLLKLGTLLRTHSSAPPMLNEDFFNHQLLLRIKAETKAAPAKRTKPSPAPRFTPWFIPRLLWAAASSFGAAALLFHFLVPLGPQQNPEAGAKYVAQFFDSRTANPHVSATAFHSKKDNVTVLWLDGLDYLPETADLK